MLSGVALSPERPGSGQIWAWTWAISTATENSISPSQLRDQPKGLYLNQGAQGFTDLTYSAKNRAKFAALRFLGNRFHRF